MPKALRLPLNLLLLACLLSGVGEVRAHHGQEFLVVQDSNVPSLWSGTVFGGIEWSRYGSVDEISMEPGFLLGVGSRVAVGATVGMSGTDGDFGYESVAPFLQVQFTPPSWPVRVAVIAGHHFADGSVEPDSVASVSAAPTRAIRPAAPATAARPSWSPPPPLDPVPDPPCGPEFGPDAPPCPVGTSPAPVPGRRLRHVGHTPAPAPPTPPSTRGATSTTAAATAGAPVRQPKPAPSRPPYDGIHRHGEDHTFARLVIEADLTAADKLIFNLIALWPDDGKPAWGYAAGYRHSFSHVLATGLEAIGDFGDANEHELVLGAYLSPTHSLTFKVGAGLGLTSTSPDFSLRSGVVWRF